MALSSLSFGGKDIKGKSKRGSRECVGIGRDVLLEAFRDRGVMEHFETWDPLVSWMYEKVSLDERGVGILD